MDMTTPTQTQLRIDPEFAALMPPLSEDERRTLEQNLVKDVGARDPLVVWWQPGDDDILVDGHNRYEICTRRGLPYQVRHISFASRADAREWIIRNQFGRRNLPTMVRAELALQLEDVIAEKAKERQRGGQGGVLLPAISPEAKETREEVAKLAGVGSNTISKVKAIRAAEAEGRVDAETMTALRQGKTTVNAVHLKQLEDARSAFLQTGAEIAQLRNDMAESIGKLTGKNREAYEQQKAESLWHGIHFSFGQLCKEIKKPRKFPTPVGEPGCMRPEEKRVELPLVPKKFEKEMREMAAVITRFINEQGL